jgi:hypothetical protein
MRVLTALFCPVLLALAAGCAANSAVPCHQVTGQILYDGKPAAGVKVYLMPTSAPMVPQIPANPRGVTGPDGRFSLSTYGEGDGAPEGGYQIVLVWPPEASEDAEESDADRLLGWYGPVRSKLTAQIKPGSNDLAAIHLARVSNPPEASEGVPGRN